MNMEKRTAFFLVASVLLAEFVYVSTFQRTEIAASISPSLERAMLSTVLVMGVQIRGEKLVPVSAGSGTVVRHTGEVLTNNHLLLLHDSSYADLFVLGRIESPDREASLTCAGKPEKGTFLPDLDLALIQCEFDLNGEPLLPKPWASITLADEEPPPGEKVWILGYPNVGGNHPHSSMGTVLGWTADQNSNSHSYLATDASVTHGNSGGAAVNSKGELIGIPTAFRIATRAPSPTSKAVKKTGLIRPLRDALPLLAE